MEQEIIKNAIEAFHRATGFTLGKRNRGAAAAYALLMLKTKGVEQQYLVECKRHLTTQTLGPVAQAIQKLPGKGMLVTEYVNPAIAERLKEMNIPFIDTVGNAYLKEPPLYIYVTGNKAPKGEGEKVGNTFNPAGLKVLFLLLCDDKLTDAPFREIAEQAGVALGTVGRVMEDLKKRRYLFEFESGTRQLVKKRDLVDQWVMLYPALLRPKLIVGRYDAPDPEWWKAAKIEAYWGGEIAAAKLTKHLKPAYVTIYTYEKPARLIVENQLRPAKDGRVEVLQAFWDNRLNRVPRGIVPPLLVYADLMATGDPRNLETAKILYERELAKHIE